MSEELHEAKLLKMLGLPKDYLKGYYSITISFDDSGSIVNIARCRYLKTKPTERLSNEQ